MPVLSGQELQWSLLVLGTLTPSTSILDHMQCNGTAMTHDGNATHLNDDYEGSCELVMLIGGF
jgi:hypothetical protein